MSRASGFEPVIYALLHPQRQVLAYCTYAKTLLLGFGILPRGGRGKDELWRKNVEGVLILFRSTSVYFSANPFFLDFSAVLSDIESGLPHHKLLSLFHVNNDDTVYTMYNTQRGR